MTGFARPQHTVCVGIAVTGRPGDDGRRNLAGGGVGRASQGGLAWRSRQRDPPELESGRSRPFGSCGSATSPARGTGCRKPQRRCAGGWRSPSPRGKSPAVVHEIACAFYDLMVDSKFLPNSPTLMNAGKGNQLQYSACYVLPVGDSMEEIFDAVKSAAIIHKSGGGTGFAFSRLRQKDAVVSSTGGKASGPVSFLRVFNGATEAVKQGGTRRGANMGILRIDHPDILEFIECKLDGGIVNFNISVAATDRFMNAIEKGEEYELTAPHNGEVVSRLPAREVFDRIVRAARQTRPPRSAWSRPRTRAESSRSCRTRRATSARSTWRCLPAARPMVSGRS